MKVSLFLRAAQCTAIGATLFVGSVAQAVPTWGVDLSSAMVQIDSDGYADNGVNGFKPLGGFFEDTASATVANVQSNLMASFFGQSAETYDLGSAVNIFGSDSGFNPDFSTLASSVGVVAIDGVGTRTLNILWRATTANEQNGIGGEGFLSDSMANIVAQIVASIDGVAPGTALTISYDWAYNGLAVIDHDAAMEDPTTASGAVGFVDEQGTGPGNLFAQLFAEPGPLGGVNSGNGSYDIITSNTSDPSYVTIDFDARATTIMDGPGKPPVNAVQHDLAGSSFNGRLTLTLPVPEPSSLSLLLVSLAFVSRRSRRD